MTLSSYLFLIYLLLNSHMAMAEANARPVIIMIAANYSEGEINAAKDAAKLRGEDVVIIPEQTDAVRQLGSLYTQREAYKLHTLDPAIKAGKATPAIWAQFNELNRQIEATSAKTSLDPLFLNRELDQAINRISTSGRVVSSIVISAHDGGGNFQGTFGVISKQSIAALGDKYPSFKDSLRSAYLLGCYTSTPFEVKSWKVSFPNIEVVAGSELKGPLRTDQNEWAWLKATMSREKKFVAAKDAETLNRIVSSVEAISHYASGIGVFSSCRTDREFYRGSLTRNKFALYTPDICEKSAAQFAINNKVLLSYANGSLPIPSDTGHSPLRDLYSFYRTHEQCNTPEHIYGPSGDDVMLLVFSSNVRKNFAKYFHDQLVMLKNKLGKGVADLPLSEQDEMLKILNEIDDGDYLSSVSLAEVNKMASRMQELIGNLPFGEGGISSGWVQIAMDFNRLLVTRIGVPFSWHDVSEGRPEDPLPIDKLLNKKDDQ